MVVIKTTETLELPEASIPELHLSKLTPERAKITAYVDSETGKSITFGELWNDRVPSFAAGLADPSTPWGGIKRGDCVGLVSPNHLDWPTIYFGTLWLGATVSGANPAYTPTEFLHQFKTSDVKVVITALPNLQSTLDACKAAGLPADRVVLLDLSSGAPTPKEYLTVNQLVERGRKLAKIPCVTYRGRESSESFAIFPYSSGTTGLPKCVELTHRNIIANTLQLAQVEVDSFRQGKDSIIGVLPLFHMFGCMMYLNVAPYCGITTVIMPKFELEAFCRAVQTYKVTFATMVPPIVILLAKNPVVDKYDLSSLRWMSSGAAPLSADVEQQIWDRLKVRIRQTWGGTEQSCSGTFMRAWEPIVQGSVGRPLPGMELKIVDPETDKELDYEQEGEILMRGPNVMNGYHSNPSATAGSITKDMFYRTGDIGKVDKNGILFITDRLKELIKVRGFQVAPAELEALLLSHPKIADCAVIGIDDEMAGELPRAWVVLKQTGSMAEEEIAKFVEGKLAFHKWLKGGVLLVPEIPKSASGKILRRIIRDTEKARIKAPSAKL